MKLERERERGRRKEIVRCEEDKKKQQDNKKGK